MSTWCKPFYYLNGADVVTGATPLVSKDADYLSLLLGTTGGCIGETCAIALIAGGIYLIAARIITPHAPVAFIGTVFLLTLIAGDDPIYAVLSGGLIIGAFFMATDYATTPLTGKGKIIFGIGCGLITFAIRKFGNYPEGVSFSILLMNLLVPYIDRLCETKPVGAKAPEQEGGFKMSMKEKIMPPLVLTLICVITSALLVAAYNITYVDTTGVITDELASGLTEIYGGSDGFDMLMNDDGTVKTYDGVTSVITNGSGTAFEITADGYSKGGLHLLIGFDESGSICGISVISIGETPGLGTKVQNKDFLDKFKGISSEDYQVDNITGATYSSKGMKAAVNTALEAYSQMKGESENG